MCGVAEIAAISGLRFLGDCKLSYVETNCKNGHDYIPNKGCAKTSRRHVCVLSEADCRCSGQIMLVEENAKTDINILKKWGFLNWGRLARLARADLVNSSLWYWLLARAIYRWGLFAASGRHHLPLAPSRFMPLPYCQTHRGTLHQIKKYMRSILISGTVEATII